MTTKTIIGELIVKEFIRLDRLINENERLIAIISKDERSYMYQLVKEQLAIYNANLDYKGLSKKGEQLKTLVKVCQANLVTLKRSQVALIQRKNQLDKEINFFRSK